MLSLEFRVQRLERQLRFYRLIFLLFLAGLLALVSAGAAKGPPDVIRARRVEVIDRRGKAMVTLKTTRNGGVVQTLGNDGRSGVSLGAGSNGGYVAVRDDKPTLFPRVELSTDDTGGLLAVRNWHGFAVEIDRDGLSVAHTREEGGLTRIDARIVLAVTENGGHIRILSATGEEAVTILADEHGTGVISTFSRQGAKAVFRPGK